MKKIKVFAVFFIALAIGSCNYEFTEDLDLSPLTQGKVAKVFLGGNVECSQLNLVDPAFQNLTLTTGRNDYSGGAFSYTWPTGLVVEVMPDGSVSWALTPEFDLLGDGSCYKVGAAIVKGSTASNIFYYGTDGATGDQGLFPPINASGTPSALSNLTFCFVECKEEGLVAVVKFHYWIDGTEISKLGKSAGEYIYKTGGWCESWLLGVSKFPSSFALHEVSSENVIGMVTVNNGVVTLDLNDGLTFDYSYLFVGTMEELEANAVAPFGCPDFSKWLFNDENGNTQTFTPGL